MKGPRFIVGVWVAGMVGTPAFAQSICEVDPSGAFGHPYANIQDALQNGCDQNSTILVYCPATGCEHEDVEIDGANKVAIVSAEVYGKGGPASFEGSTAITVSIQNSTGITISGFHAVRGPDTAIWVSESEVDLVGPPISGHDAYTEVEAQQFGLLVEDADVDVTWFGFHGAQVGLQVQSMGGTDPVVRARGVAFRDNEHAAVVHGVNGDCPIAAGATLIFESDHDLTRLNYVVNNENGFLLTGNASLQIDHTVLAGNLRVGAQPLLFDMQGASTLQGRNVLAYDNDQRPNPGDPTPWSSGLPNTGGHIVDHRSCGEVRFEASTFADNEADLVFSLHASVPSGPLLLDHTLVVNNLGKPVSASSYHPSCPSALDMADSVFWDNFGTVDPPVCFNGIVQDPNIQYGFMAQDVLQSFPNIDPPLSDLYRIDAFEPRNPYPLPPGLFDVGDWGVDGTPDSDDLDMGFHSPL